MPTTPLLQTEDLQIHFRTDRGYLTAVQQINLQICKGETVALVGESGCGKSVTSLSLMGLLSSSVGKVEGKILFKGEQLIGKSEKEMREIRGRDISMIFQEPMTSLNPVHKIGKQIGEVLHLHTRMDKDQRQAKTIQLLQKVGIPRAEKIVESYPHQLSGGMKQRVMIAMALACNPDLLIADEPTTALDVTIQAQILDLMNDLRTEYNTAILLITHDLGVVAEMANRVLVMYYGQIVEEADVHALFAGPLHPYTRGLLQSVPSLDGDVERLMPIQGSVPSLGSISCGCPFQDRCERAFDKCYTEAPPVIACTDMHRVRCWLYEEEESGR